MINMNIEVFYSNNHDNWATPKSLYDKMMTLGYYDPCPLFATHNGLNEEWKDKNFVNPPYSKLKEWIIKSICEAKKGKEIIMLIPARTDTQAFKMLYEYGSHFVFITGRLKFNDKGTAPFPSVLVNLTGSQSTFELIERDKLL